MRGQMPVVMSKNGNPGATAGWVINSTAIMENKMEIPWKSHINYVRQSSHTPGYLSQVYAVNMSRRCLHSPVQSSIRHRSRGVKSAQVPGDRGMRKDNIYTKEYDSASKGRSSYHLNQPTWPGGHNTEGNKPGTRGPSQSSSVLHNSISFS